MAQTLYDQTVCYSGAMASDGGENLIEKGYCVRRENRLDDAKALFDEAVELCGAKGDLALLARALTGLGQIERDMGDLEGALRHYEDAVQIYRSLDNALALAHTVRHVGDILRNLDRLELAEPCYSEALSIYRSHPESSPLDLANTIRGFALLKVSTGDGVEAKLLWQEAARLYAAVDVQAGAAEAERQIALLTPQ